MFTSVSSLRSSLGSSFDWKISLELLCEVLDILTISFFFCDWHSGFCLVSMWGKHCLMLAVFAFSSALLALFLRLLFRFSSWPTHSDIEIATDLPLLVWLKVDESDESLLTAPFLTLFCATLLKTPSKVSLRISATNGTESARERPLLREGVVDESLVTDLTSHFSFLPSLVWILSRDVNEISLSTRMRSYSTNIVNTIAIFRWQH